jgi:hypothetical protein
MEIGLMFGLMFGWISSKTLCLEIVIEVLPL